MALNLLYSEGHDKYLMVIQWSAIIYWNVLKSRVHNCLSLLSLHGPYNQFENLFRRKLRTRKHVCVMVNVIALAIMHIFRLLWIISSQIG